MNKIVKKARNAAFLPCFEANMNSIHKTYILYTFSKVFTKSIFFDIILPKKNDSKEALTMGDKDEFVESKKS